MSETCSSTLDPRIRRTRVQLQNALATLLDAHDFERISVQEITDAAGVNRATFYAHYTDKFALLECMVAARFMALLDERGIVLQGGCTNALRGLVVGLCDFLTRSTGHHDPAPSRTLQPHMETALVTVLRHIVRDGLTQHDPSPSPSGVNPDMRAAAIAWAIYGATRESLTPANHPPAEQIAAAVITLVAPLMLAEPAQTTFADALSS